MKASLFAQGCVRGLAMSAIVGLGSGAAGAAAPGPVADSELAQATLTHEGPAQAPTGTSDARKVDEVRPYATVDVYQDAANRADGGWGSQLRSGGMSPSYVGIDVRHAFGDVAFRAQVEQGIDVVNLRVPGKRIGNRTLTLEASGRYGTLRLGRQFTPHALFLGGEIDAFTVGFAGSPYAVWDAGVPLERRSYALLYEAPPSDTWTGQLMLATDARRTDAPLRDRDGIFARVKRHFASGFVGMTAVTEANRDRSQTRNATALAGGANLGEVTLTAGYQLEDGRQTAHQREAMLGLNWTHDRSQWLVSWGDSRGSDGSTQGGTVAGLAYVFLYSGKTNFYASVARLRNCSGSSFDLGMPMNPGGKASDAMVGVRQQF